MTAQQLQIGYHVRLPGLKAWADMFNADGGFVKHPEVAALIRDWFTAYQRYLIARYSQYSGGGGDWIPLAASTLERKKRGGLLDYILRATDLLYESFALDLVEVDIADTGLYIRVAPGGGTGVSYPGRSISAAEVLFLHQEGTSRMPARPVVVPPEQQMIDELAQKLEAMLAQIFNTAS